MNFDPRCIIRTNKISPWVNTKNCFVPTSNDFTSDLKVLSIWIEYLFHIQSELSIRFERIFYVGILLLQCRIWSLDGFTDDNLIIHASEIDKAFSSNAIFHISENSCQLLVQLDIDTPIWYNASLFWVQLDFIIQKMVEMNSNTWEEIHKIVAKVGHAPSQDFVMWFSQILVACHILTPGITDHVLLGWNISFQ